VGCAQVRDTKRIGKNAYLRGGSCWGGGCFNADWGRGQILERHKGDLSEGYKQGLKEKSGLVFRNLFVRV